jgi:predicted DCC family thiol-disulfide oxidoreductase YuxK
VSGGARRPVLIYDGHCRLCTREATRLARWVGGRVGLESYRDPAVIARHPGLTPELCEQGLQLVMPDGRIVSGAEAAAATLRLRAPLAPLAWLYYLPGVRQLANVIYRAIVRNRFRLGGATCAGEECRLHRD